MSLLWSLPRADSSPGIFLCSTFSLLGALDLTSGFLLLTVALHNQQHTQALGLEQKNLGVRSGSAIYQLCGLGQVTLLSLSYLICKLGIITLNGPYLVGLSCCSGEVMQVQTLGEGPRQCTGLSLRVSYHTQPKQNPHPRTETHEPRAAEVPGTAPLLSVETTVCQALF